MRNEGLKLCLKRRSKLRFGSQIIVKTTSKTAFELGKFYKVFFGEGERLGLKN